MMNVTKTVNKALLLLLFVALFGGFGKLAAQAPVYPVQLNVQLLPPYTPCLADYVAGNFSRLRVVALQRDLTQSNYHFVLKFTVKKDNSIVMQTNMHQLSDDFVVRPGVATTISGAQLSGLFTNIQYNRGKSLCLEEGFYELIFQAFDQNNPAIPVSDLSSTFAYFMQGQPPFLTSPADNACIQDYTSLINFTWVDSDVIIRPTKNYRLEIYELLDDNDIANYKNIHTYRSNPYIEENGIKMPFYSLFVTAAFQRDKYYAWRVQVRNSDNESDNTAAYVNEGFSEMRLFKYGKCADVFAEQPVVLAPELVDYKPTLLEISTTNYSATAVWRNDQYYGDEEEPIYISRFDVEYRRNDGAEPGTITREWVRLRGSRADAVEDGASDRLLLNGVSRGVDYEVRVQAVLADGRYSQYSDVRVFKIDREDTPVDCGTPLPDIENQDDIAMLSAGDVINANGYEVTIKTITRNSSDDSFSGYGVVQSPILKAIPLQVKFDNIRINTDKKLIQGRIVTIYDIATSATLDLNGMLNKGATGRVLAERPAVISTVKTTIINSEPLPAEYRNSVIKDVDGNVYAVDAEGYHGGAIGHIEPNMAIERGSYSSAIGKVEFSVPSTMIFDADATPFENYGRVSEYYETLKGGTPPYKVPWTLVPEGQKRTITAKLTTGNVNPASIRFVTTGNVVLEHSYENGKFTIPVFGGNDRSSQGIYAVVADNSNTPEGVQNYNTLGKILLAHYKEEPLYVVIVPVNRPKTDLNQKNIKDGLNSIYNPVGIQVNVTIDDRFDIPEEYSFLKDGLAIEGSGAWTNETEEMKMLKLLYSKADDRDAPKDGVIYLFALNNAETGGVEGDMPRGKRTGYIFGNNVNDARLIAHELGHGAFALEHTFETYGVKNSDNLMDYNNGKHLTCWQWDLVHNPIPVWSFLDKDEDGMNLDYVLTTIQKIKTAHDSDKNLPVKNLPSPRNAVTAKNIQLGNDVFSHLQVEISTTTKTDIHPKGKITEVTMTAPLSGIILRGVEVDGIVRIFVIKETSEEKQKEDARKLYLYLTSEYKNLLLFVNGYDPTQNIFSSPDIVYTKDELDYWGEIDNMFVKRTNINNVVYGNGNKSISTSNHYERSAFFNSMGFCATSLACYHNTTPNVAGFNSRVADGRRAGTDMVKKLKEGKIYCRHEMVNGQMVITDITDVVAHSMGYAYALGMIEKLQEAGIKIGNFYVIAPENACSGWVPSNIDQIWQYGSDEIEHPIVDRDGVAPQCPIPGIGTRRVYIPLEDPLIPRGFVDSHSVTNYWWIFNIQPNQGNSSRGYVAPRE